MMWMILLFACGTASTPEVVEPTVASTPVELAAVADRIVSAPADADSILREAGLDRGSFEAKLYDIAADPEQTRLWLEARQR